ncbi:uncharacterized protein SPSK_09647 [Sporothrix schenckii 1099-18]|uniref:CENP-V/GFA domain-containing protein n=2 Tax=Sporothrix schenckii TaxID=29908 RepID=U7PW18_SPOS1|nr:uncharacterized protein SPSK_09647 [Sporothrix schenckii 1099-18]ERS99853.1 hypothetical protein HMPREF1624_03218 [Sporothrix schenckii ATCC 58251]KJR85758.1 hypothetical protein SPSK_09647 [Sporothrix schenckii 1099-18]
MTETTYRANCHCGKFVYEVTFPEPLSKGVVCNCSICLRKGYVFVFPPKDSDINIVKGSIDDLESYTFGKKAFNHKFCGDCGSPLMVVPSDSTKGKGLNARCFQGPVDVWALEKTDFDGAALDPKFEPVPFTGTEPTGAPQGDGSATPRIYHGSCHCGAVRVALRSQPLDETLDREKQGDRVVECDCSICQRNGCRWFYPMADQVSFHDPDNNLKVYSFGRFVNKKSFCKTCGVCLSNPPTNLSDEEIAKLPPIAQTETSAAWRKRLVNSCPINTRVLYDVDIDKLPVRHVNGYTLIRPEYVNP